MAKRKKQENKRRLLLLILLLVCALVLLGGATYAWFTANTKVAIEAMDLEVQVANGIEISADAEHWGSRLNLEDLYKAAGLSTDTSVNVTTIGSVNQFPKLLTNVSSVGNIKTANNRLDLFNGTATQVCYLADDKGDPIKDKLYIVTDEDTEADGYTSIEKCSKEIFTALTQSSVYNEGVKACKDSCESGVGVVTFDMYLKLDANSVVSLAPGSYINDLNPETDFGLKNTMRVAFVTLGTQTDEYYAASDDNVNEDGILKTYASATEKPTVAAPHKGYAGPAGARLMNAFGSISIWEPNINAHTVAAVDKAKEDYDLDTITTTTEVVTHGLYANPADPKGDGSEPSALPIVLNKANGTDATGGKFFAAQTAIANADQFGVDKPYKNKVNYFKTQAVLKSDIDAGKKGISEAKDLFTARAGVTKVRVYIWVEGNDVDTINSATTSKLQALFSFTTANTTGAIDDDSADLEVYGEAKAPVYREGYTDPQAGTLEP